MKMGYGRVSTEDQNPNLQTDALKKAGCDRIFVDKGISGARRDRPQLEKALAELEEGDQLVVWRLDRLGRSLPHLIEIVAGLGDRGVDFQSLTENIDTSSAGGELLFHILGALAQFERSLISERTKAGMASAKSRGVHVGRPRAMSEERIDHARRLLDEGKTQRQIARVLKVSPSTLYRALNAAYATGNHYDPMMHQGCAYP